jgi:hypothetical protein
MPLTAEQVAQWDQTRQPTIYGVLTVLLFLSNVSLVLRLFMTLKHWRRLLIEDYFMICAVLLSDGIICALLAATSKGFGLHEFRVLATQPTAIIAIFQIVWAYAVMNGFCFLTIKLSILFFYRRLFFVDRWFRIVWWANLVYAILWFVGSTAFYIFQCTPVKYYWTRLEVAIEHPATPIVGKCVSSIASIGTPIMLNTISDLAILLLPVPILFKLQTSLQKQIRLVLLFSLGLVATASGFVRFVFIFQNQTNNDQTCKSRISYVVTHCLLTLL